MEMTRLRKARDVELTPNIGASIQERGRGRGWPRGRWWTRGVSLAKGCDREASIGNEVMYSRNDYQIENMGLAQIT